MGICPYKEITEIFEPSTLKFSQIILLELSVNVISFIYNLISLEQKSLILQKFCLAQHSIIEIYIYIHIYV